MAHLNISGLMRSAALSTLALTLGAGVAMATWSTDSTVNNVVSQAQYVHGGPEALSDGAGGTFVAFETTWSTTNDDVYLQFIDANGNLPFNQVTVGTGGQPVIADDGAGGLFIAWRSSNGRLYIHRYDATLTAVWGSPLPVTTSNANQSDPAIISDNAGGAIVSWTQQISFSNTDIHAQRFDATGARLWSPSSTGLVVQGGAGHQRRPDLATDNAQGALVVWEHGSGTGSNINSRYINPGSSVPAPGWPFAQYVTIAPQMQIRPMAVSDGAGDFLVGWYDSRNGLSELYVQRITNTGFHAWTADGVLVGNGLSSEPLFDLANDGSQGAVLTWSSYSNIKFQRLDNNGAYLWGTSGLDLTTGSSFSNQQGAPQLASDGAGGAMIAWHNFSKFTGSVGNIYAQYVDTNGPAWSTVTVSDAANAQHFPAVVNDGSCPARVAWRDNRPGAEGVYAQRILCSGVVGIIGGGGGGGIGIVLGDVQVLDHYQDFEVSVTTEWVKDVKYLHNFAATLSYDPKVLELVDVKSGTIERLGVEVDREQGVVYLESPNGSAREGKPLFNLVFKPLTSHGSSAVSMVSADSEGVRIYPDASVVTIGERR